MGRGRPSVARSGPCGAPGGVRLCSAIGSGVCAQPLSASGREASRAADAPTRAELRERSGLGSSTALGAPKQTQTARSLRSSLLLFALGACGGEAPPGPVTTSATTLEPEVVRLIETHVAKVRADPSLGRAHGTLGMAYAANGLWEEAEACYANAARLEPAQVLWTYRRSIALEEMGETERSFALLREAAAAATGEAAPHHSLGSAYLRDGDLDRAEAEFRIAKRLAGGQPQPDVGLAQVALERGDFAAACTTLEGVVAEHPQYGHARYLLGQAYRGLGRMEDASRELALGLDSHPEALPDAFTAETRTLGVSLFDRMARGIDLLEQGRIDEGVRTLEELYARMPNDDRVLNNLAAGYIDQGQNAKAFELLTHLVELKPNDFPAYINLASCALRLGRTDESLRFAERAVELAPEQARAHYVRAEALAGKGALQDALVALKATVRLDPSYAAGHFALAEVATAVQNLPLAVQAYKDGLALQPDNVVAMFGLTELLLRTGRIPEADTTLRRAEALAPNEPRVRALREAVDKAR